MEHHHVGYTADGHEITAVGGVVYDDEYIAAEQAHADAQRAAIIEVYGSMIAYDTWVLAETKRMRVARRDAFRRHRVARAQMPRRIVAAGAVTTQQGRREARPAIQRRRTSSSSSTASADPPDEDSESSSGELRHISGLLAAELARIAERLRVRGGVR